MYYRMPSYYNDFKCIADQCPDTCCAGWGIVIDDKTMNNYKKMPGQQGEYVRKHVNMQESVYIRDGERCSFLNERNLCELYIHAGEENMCKTCRLYPRHFEEYGNLVEAALSLSCPVAARMIVDNPGRDRFRIKENEIHSPHEKEVDEMLLRSLLDVRKHIFHIIADRTMNIRDRMNRLLNYGEDVQRYVYEYEKNIERPGFRLFHGHRNNKYTELLCHNLEMVTAEELRNCRNDAQDCSKGRTENDAQDCGKGRTENDTQDSIQDCREVCVERQQYMRDYLDMLLGMENINADWPEHVENTKHILYDDMSVEVYMQCCTEFDMYMREREYEYEHLLNYFIYTYFLGGVYDYNVQAMVKMAVLSTVVIREMGMAQWKENDRNFSVDDQIVLCYRYSRQVEHSDENLMSLEGILTAHPGFNESRMKMVIL